MPSVRRVIRQLRTLASRFGRAPRLAAAALFLVLAALSAVGAQAAAPPSPAAPVAQTLAPGPDTVAVTVTLTDGGAGRFFLVAGQHGDLVLAGRQEAEGGVTITSRIRGVRILSIGSEAAGQSGGITDEISGIPAQGTILTVAVPVADVAQVARVNAVVVFTARKE